MSCYTHVGFVANLFWILLLRETNVVLFSSGEIRRPCCLLVHKIGYGEFVVQTILSSSPAGNTPNIVHIILVCIMENRTLPAHACLSPENRASARLANCTRYPRELHAIPSVVGIVGTYLKSMPPAQYTAFHQISLLSQFLLLLPKCAIRSRSSGNTSAILPNDRNRCLAIFQEGMFR